MKKEFSYEKYSPKYKGQVIKLLDNLWRFNDDEKLDYFKWKFEDNPYTEDVEGYIALDGDKVVAFRGYMIQPMRVNDFEFLNAQLADTVTHPDYRRRGLFQSITQFSLSELEKNPHIRVSLNSSSGGPTLGGYLKLGWVPFSEREHLFRFTLYGMLSKLLHSCYEFKNVCIDSDNKKYVITEECRAEELASIPYEYVNASHLHDEKYFRWRLSNPRNKFVYAYLYEDGKLTAYVILVYLGAGRYDIVDFNSTKSVKLRELISIFCGNLHPLYISLWTVGKSNAIFKSSSKFGFHNLNFLLNRFKRFKKPPFLLRHIGMRHSQESNSSCKWDLYKIIADEI